MEALAGSSPRENGLMHALHLVGGMMCCERLVFPVSGRES